MMGPAEAIETFERFTLLGPRWFFRIVDTGNNEILAASQPYKSKWGRDKTANRLSRALRCPIVPGKRK